MTNEEAKEIRCPMTLNNPDGYIPCNPDDCVWWISESYDKGNCAVTVIAEKLKVKAFQSLAANGRG